MFVFYIDINKDKINDVVCSIDLTEYQSEDIFVDKTDDDCYTLSCSMEGGDVR